MPRTYLGFLAGLGLGEAFIQRVRLRKSLHKLPLRHILDHKTLSTAAIVIPGPHGLKENQSSPTTEKVAHARESGASLEGHEVDHELDLDEVEAQIVPLIKGGSATHHEALLEQLVQRI